jgi:hypothetical protein
MGHSRYLSHRACRDGYTYCTICIYYFRGFVQTGGNSAKAEAAGSVIGHLAKAVAAGSVIGHLAKAEAAGSVIGHLAKAEAAGSVIGHLANLVKVRSRGLCRMSQIMHVASDIFGRTIGRVRPGDETGFYLYKPQLQLFVRLVKLAKIAIIDESDKVVNVLVVIFEYEGRRAERTAFRNSFENASNVVTIAPDLDY